MSADSGPGRREVAQRLFAAEFDDADYSYSESDEERAPNYVVSPTGAHINRLFAVGVLTEVEDVNEDVLRARVVDPTGAFVSYAGQYQPDEMAFLERTSPPAFLAVTGKARTFEPEDSDRVYTSVRPESINEVDADTRDRWVVTTAEATLRRLAVMRDALATDLDGEELTAELESRGVPASLAAGVPRALDRYGTTTAYLEAVRRLAVDALEVVAGEREEVRSLDVAPDDAGDGDVDLGPLPDAPFGEASDAAAATAGTGAESETRTQAEPDAAASTAEADADVEAEAEEETDPEPEAETEPPSPEPGAEAPEETPDREFDTGESPGPGRADAETSDDQLGAVPEVDAGTAGNESGATADPDPDVGGAAAASEAGSESEPTDTDERRGETEAVGAEGATATEDADELGDFAAEPTEANDADRDTGFDRADPATGAEGVAGSSGAETADTAGATEATGPAVETQAGADEAESVDAEGEGEGEGESPPADAGPEATEMYELDESERREVESQFDTDFSTGNEVGDPGEADIETPGADEATGESPDADAEAEPTPTDAGGESEAETETDPDASADADVDLETAAVEAMEELDDGDGVDRERVVAALVDRHGVDPGDADDAIQDALMSGRCYEAGEDTLKPI